MTKADHSAQIPLAQFSPPYIVLPIPPDTAKTKAPLQSDWRGVFISTRLRARDAAAIVRAVKIFRLLPLLLAFALLTGCATSYTNNIFTRHRLYRKIRVTDPEGRLIADWIAEGGVWRYDTGYRFKAVERRTGPPYPQLIQYPQGRKVIINGPNIVVMPCGKPEWLYHIDGF